jgi:BRCT domain type II-containing protein
MKIQRVARPSPNSSALRSETLHAHADLMLYSSWAAAKAAQLAGPSNPGSKAVPSAAVPDCLAGLSFVFTGELSSFSREEAVDIAKRFCGWVTLLSLYFRRNKQPLTPIPAAW